MLQQIYRNKEIVTDITPNELKELPLLCIKSVNFPFNGEFYLEKDGIAMGFLSESVIVGILMVGLERSLILLLSSYTV